MNVDAAKRLPATVEAVLAVGPSVACRHVVVRQMWHREGSRPLAAPPSRRAAWERLGAHRVRPRVKRFGPADPCTGQTRVIPSLGATAVSDSRVMTVPPGADPEGEPPPALPLVGRRRPPSTTERHGGRGCDPFHRRRLVFPGRLGPSLVEQLQPTEIRPAVDAPRGPHLPRGRWGAWRSQRPGVLSGAALLRGIAPTTLERWVRAGRIPSELPQDGRRVLRR